MTQRGPKPWATRSGRMTWSTMATATAMRAGQWLSLVEGTPQAVRASAARPSWSEFGGSAGPGALSMAGTVANPAPCLEEVRRTLGYVDRVQLQDLERHHVERALVGGRQHHEGGRTVVVGP